MCAETTEIIMSLLLEFFLITFLITLGVSDDVLFSNSWAVEVRGGPEVADDLARKHGFVNRGQVGSMPSVYHFIHVLSPSRMRRSLDDPHPVLIRLQSENLVEYAEHQVIKQRYKRRQSYSYSPPSNTDWSEQWYLHRSSGHDMNVERVWEQNITGRGAVVSILDDGIEHNHPDLQQNYDPLASYDFNDDDSDPIPRYDPTNENKHGTRCAGEVAARIGGQCGVGVAFGSKVGGVRMLDGDVTDVVEASSLSLKTQHIHVYSSSWGPNDDGATVDGPGRLASKAFVDGVKYGRNGLGSIYVWAAGNGGRYGDSCNCDGYAVSPLTISVGSASEHDKKPWYLEMCSSTLTSTYSSGGVGEKQIVTTDIRRTCTDRHTGTSASAPLAAGMIALALEANSNLTWRDIQYLMVYTSNPQYPDDNHWQVNAAGLKVSHWYGFGIINGAALVNRARNWIKVPQHNNCTFNVTTQLQEQPKVASGDSPITLSIEVTGCSLVYLEHVQAVTSLHIVNGMRKDISIYLTSPSGTKSTLLPFRPHDRHKDGFHLWPFMTVHSWGERPHGKWIFSVIIKSGSEVALQSLELILYGTQSVPQSVSAVPSQCHPECLGGCAKEGPEHCDVCKHYRLAYASACVERCPIGTYVNGHMCRSCPPLCAECMNAHSCSQCQLQAFRLLNGSCSSKCSDGTFATSNNSCSVCHQSCLTCDGSTGSNCTSCHPQFVLQMHSCVMRESTSCPSGQYFDHRAHVCRHCHESCTACSGKESTQCTSCLEGNLLNLKGQCVDSRHLRSCSSGQYFDGSTLECLACPSTCISCSHQLNCTSCQLGYHLNQLGVCISCPDTLLLYNNSCVEDCPLHFYRSNWTCKACHSDCRSCVNNSNDDCLSCFPGRFLDGQKCVLECPAGTFGKNGVCSPCITNCFSCMSRDFCDSCSSGYYLLSLQSSGTKCVSQCPSGYVLHSPSRSCQSCPANCTKCSTSSSCLTCQPNHVYYAPSGSCLSVCPDGYYSSLNGQCMACQPPCSTCANSPLKCTMCLSGMALDMVSLVCQSCCNPDKVLTQCCDCDRNDRVCYWFNGTVTAAPTNTDNAVFAIHLGVGITLTCLFIFLFLVFLLVLARFCYLKSSSKRRYHMLLNREGLDIAGDSGSDTDLYIPDTVVS